MKIAELFTEIKVTGLQNVDGKLKKLNGGLKATEKALNDMAAIGVKAFAGLGVAVAGVTKLYADQEKAEKKLETVIRSTGKAAGFTADEMKAHAAQLQKVTTFGDEAIIEMQALLSTFTQIKGIQFQQATAAILDISTLMGNDLKSAALQVGKALNDPIKGVSALSEVGVSFTQKQREMIKALQETGKVAEAQQIILAELNKEFGGQAAAAAETFAGKLGQLKNAASDLGEALGEAVIPHLQSAVKWATDFVNAVQVEVIDALGGSLKDLDFMVVFDRFLYAFPQIEASLFKLVELVDRVKLGAQESLEGITKVVTGGLQAATLSPSGIAQGIGDIVQGREQIDKGIESALNDSKETVKKQLLEQKETNKLLSGLSLGASLVIEQ